MDWAILDILRADGSIVVNKRLIKKLDCHTTAMVFSELSSRYCYFMERGRLNGAGYFYNTVADLQEATCIGRRQQDTAVKRLVDMGLIEAKVMGIPATRHFRFTRRNVRNLQKLLARGSTEKRPGDLFFDALEEQGADGEVTEEIREEFTAEAERNQKEPVYF